VVAGAVVMVVVSAVVMVAPPADRTPKLGLLMSNMGAVFVNHGAHDIAARKVVLCLMVLAPLLILVEGLTDAREHPELAGKRRRRRGRARRC